MVFIPLIVLAIGALATKKIAESMIVASFLGAILVYKGGFFTGYIELLYETLSDPSYQFVLIILMCFGAMIKLFQESGALLGFEHFVSKHAKGPKKPLIVAWFMNIILFVDDYLNTLAVSFSMKDITDNNHIPREHLAFQTNSMAVSMGILVPFSSWTAFTIGLISNHGLSFIDYAHAIPYMFFPIIIVIVCLLVDLGIIPKFGLLKDAYRRVEKTGETFIQGATESSIVSIDPPKTSHASSALNVVIPVIVLVAVTFVFDNDLIHGLIAALIVQAILYFAQKIMTVSEFVEFFFEGAQSMTNLAIIICLAFILSGANEKLGVFDVLIGGLEAIVSPSYLPLIIFLFVSIATFATAGSWIIQVITIPIFIPLAISLNIDVSYIIGALMSGITFGCSLCFYSDAVFMTSAGTGLSNLKIVRVAMPYAIGVGIISAIGYLILGLI